jgi:Tetratricopeptide repeat
LLSRVRAGVVRVGPLIGWWGPVDHHLGSLAGLAGRYEEAEEHLRGALRLEERVGGRPFRARSLAALSQVGKRNDPDGALKLADDARSAAAATAAAGIIAEVDVLVGAA